ncbi:MAG: DUF924 family protein [Rhizobiales bacterium]|nr:DUF924 family protein [Hyphomicrobiales bacterium]
MIDPKEILDFWFLAGEGRWFKKDQGFDAEIRKRFSQAHADAAEGRYDAWATTAQGSLALVILLDQFSRNLYRDDHRAFEQDAKALLLARQAIERRHDVELPMAARRWLYMPFMHSEDMTAQKQGLEYFATRLEEPETLKFAKLHADIIQRFGRFPHRNAVLGRRSSEAEQQFLAEGGFSG